MKFIKLAAAAAVLLGSLAEAYASELAANPLTVEDLSVTPGMPSELVLYYDTDEQYVGLQFELTLPDGITFAMDPEDQTLVAEAVTNTELARTHELFADVHPDGLYKAVFVSPRGNKVIQSGSWLLKIPIVVSEEFSGSGVGSIKGCRYATDATETAEAREDRYLEPENFEIYVAPTGIRLSQSALELEPNETAELTVEYDSASAVHLPLTWTTSDATVATVDEQGVVTALKHGNAVITVSLTDNPAIAATCEVTVDIESGLNESMADDPGDSKVYDLSGNRVDAQVRQRGSIVIVQSAAGARKEFRP